MALKKLQSQSQPQEKPKEQAHEDKDILNRKADLEFKVKNSTNLERVDKEIKKDNELVKKKVDQILKNQPLDTKKVNVNQTA